MADPVAPSERSILDDIKKALGLAADYTVFDQEIIMHINSALGELFQLGVGPTGGFEIDSSTQKWTDLLAGDKTLSMVRTWMYYKVKINFDPPENGAVMMSIEKQLEELAWRIMVARDEEILETVTVDPQPNPYYDPFE